MLSSSVRSALALVRAFSTTAAAPAAAVEKRTYNIVRSSGNQIPVYTDYMNGRTRIVTVVRKITGDAGNLVADLKKSIPTVTKANVEIRPGSVRINGNHKEEIVKHFEKLGF